MVVMKFNDYAKLDDEIAKLPGRVENYGLTEKDLKRMEHEPEKYFKYAMFLLNQPCYADTKKNHVFENEDALPQENVVKRLNDLINDTVRFEDEG